MGTQFGLSWFPYTVQTVRGGQRWPVLLTATLLTPFTGTTAIYSTAVLLI